MVNKAKQMWLFTNRNCLVFDENGEQIPEYQVAITCYSLDRDVAKKVCDEATEFHICSWREWEHEITKKHMMYLLGLVTREDDS
jgi:hypothetical protein